MKGWKIQQTQALEGKAVAGFSERFITAVKRNQGRRDPRASPPNEMCFYYNGLDQKLIVGEALDGNDVLV